MENFLDRPQTVWARRALFQVHLWLGMLTGLYVFVVCVSGAALVFRIDIQRAIYPQLFTPRASGPIADPVAIMESVTHAYPAARLSGIDAPTTARPTYLAYATSGQQQAWQQVVGSPLTSDLSARLASDSPGALKIVRPDRQSAPAPRGNHRHRTGAGKRHHS